MTECRHCGERCREEDLLAVHEGGGCRHCNGSPACSRCGHARRHHRGTFGGGEPGCRARIAVEHTLAVGRCGCEGYTTERATFEEQPAAIEVEALQLRLPGDPAPTDAPRLAPVRDVFDEGRRLRDISESPGVPWRPPS